MPNARIPSNGLFAPLLSGTGSLSPIFSNVISGILESTSVYWGSLRNSSFVRTIAKTSPASAAAASNSSARHCRTALPMDSLLLLHLRKLSARLQPGVNVERNHVTPIACSPEERQLEERIVSRQEQGAASVHRFPFAFEESTEAPQSFPDIDMNVLSFAGARFPERCQRDGARSQADRGHGAEPEAAGYDRILSVESKL